MSKTKRVFRKLSNVEHVRLRTGMWLGQNSLSVYEQHFFERKGKEEDEAVTITHEEIEEIPAKQKCLDEAVMNAVDEYNRNQKDRKIKKREKMSSLRVTLSEDLRQITVEDNGRGIPTKNAESVFLHLMYGENFEDEARKEHVAGQNGVGISLVRIVSDYFFISTASGGKRYEKLFTCSEKFLSILAESSLSPAEQKSLVLYYDENSHFQDCPSFVKLSASEKKSLRSEMKRSKMESTLSNVSLSEHGTLVSFRLNPTYFDNHETTFSPRLIEQYLSDTAMNNPGLEVFFQNGNKKKIFFFKKGLEELLKKTGFNICPILFEKGDLKIESYLIEGEGKSLSWINSNFASLGGSAIEYYENRLCDEVRKKPTLLQLEKRLKTTITRNDVRRCFHIFHSFSFPLPRFKSQDKSYLINDFKEEIRLLIKLNLEKIIRKLSLTEKIKEQVERRARVSLLDQASKDVKRAQRKFVPKHIAPTNVGTTGGMKTLFIAEGDSAIAGLRPVRDPSSHGLFPLRGKPLNVKGLSLARALQNEEIKNLITILNLPINGAKPNPREMNYQRICIITDADYDGFAIRALVMNFFFEYWPSLFSNGQVFIAEAPLYELEVHETLPGEKTERRIIFCLDDEAFQKIIQSSNLKLLRKKRNKGLGETSRRAMQHTIFHCLKRMALTDAKKARKMQELWFSKSGAEERRKAISSYSQLFFSE